MKKFIVVFLLMMPSLSFAFQEGSFEEKGILRSPVRHEGFIYGEPGEVVNFTYTESDSSKIDMEINGTVLEDFSWFHVIPYDPEFSVTWAYLLLVRERPVWSTRDAAVEVKYRRQLADNIITAFPDHPLLEEIFAIRYDLAEEYVERTSLLGGYGTGWIYTGLESYDGLLNYNHRENIPFIDEYIMKYPDGPNRDRLEWIRAQLQNSVREHEFAESTITQAQAFEKHLKEHPDTIMADEIKLRIAYLNRYTHERIAAGRSNRSGYTLEDGKRFLQKSVGLYQELLLSENIKNRETARLILYNLKHNRRFNINPNHWR